ncbi:hypothetical protein AB0O28_37665 [Microbispora sp. NPDC088329]
MDNADRAAAVIFLSIVISVMGGRGGTMGADGAGASLASGGGAESPGATW